MLKPTSRSVLAAYLTVLLAAPQPLSAWGNSGHEAIAYVAWQQLTEPTKERVLVLLKKVPTLHEDSGDIPGFLDWVSQLPLGLSPAQQNMFLFMRAATWADSIKHHGLIDSDTPPADITTEVNIGFSDDHSHGYWHFIDTAFASDEESVPATPKPNVVTQIAALRTDIASNEGEVLKAYDLVWLLHLVGDIHQPLHASVRFNGGDGDLGGNLVKIKLPVAMQAKFKCPPSKTTPRELHAFWDDLPGSCPADTALPFAVTYAKALPLLLSDTALPGADKVTDIDPADWASDSLAIAEKDAYAAPIGAGLQPDDGTAGYLITQTYYSQASSDARDRITLAGARLAKLLNENLK
jgi:S1/P1 Nuclease